MYRILAIVLAAGLSGCGFFSSAELEKSHPVLGGAQAPPPAAENIHARIPAPEIPPELQEKARDSVAAAPVDEQLYTVTIQCESPDKELCELFEKGARLAVMNREKQGPAPLPTLDQRLRVSLEQDGRDILHSLGYYGGQVSGSFTPGREKNSLAAAVKFTPGPRYHLGKSIIILEEPLEEPPPADVQPPPADLTEAGLKAGDEARAEAVLAAVNKTPGLFHNRGYPRAALSATRYTVVPTEQLLEAEVWIKPGEFARMGDISPQGEPVVDEDYLKAYRSWKIGQPWKQDSVDLYLAELRGTGLFQTVNGGPARRKDAEGLTPLRLRLTPAPPRTVGGLISYDTDFGPGVTGYWEHRNLTKHGDRLRLDLPLWADLQQFTANYRFPFFLDPRQDLIAKGGALHQDSEAYELWSAALSAGIERRLSRRWRVSLMGAAEAGALTDPGEEEKKFFMYGLPFSAAYDNANDIMDPTQGQRLIFLAAPYNGSYKKDFTVIKTRVEGQAFIPLFTKEVVLAVRAVWGSVWAADSAQDLPSSLRFYSGGGGSVRGYEYQSIGPRNADLDPMGGISQFETSLETRWRLNETFGLVAFLDGGMVYDDPAANVLSDLLWGTGAGLRFYTPIGPVRADLAFPLDRRENDSAWQAYISIGQSF